MPRRARNRHDYRVKLEALLRSVLEAGQSSSMNIEVWFDHGGERHGAVKDVKRDDPPAKPDRW